MTATRLAGALTDRLRVEGGGVALIPYLLGIAYSDPLADGPVIQRAGQRALDAGATVGGCLDIAAKITAERAAPVVLMTYVNPVLAYGVRRFARDAAQTGVSGVIIPDLPVEEAGDIAAELRAADLATVFLVAPTSSAERIAAACAASTGFVYCVTITGITGSRAALPDSVAALLTKVRRQTDLPVAAGFGISKPEHIAGLKGYADAAVVGSAIVNELDRGRDAGELVKELLAACS